MVFSAFHCKGLKGRRISLEGLRGAADAQNLDRERIVRLDFRQDLDTAHGAAEDAVQVVETGIVAERDEEFAAVSVGPGVGHREGADFLMAQAGHEFIGKLVRDAFVARVLQSGIAALDDEAGHDAIPGQAGVEWLAVARRQCALSETDEAGDGQRNLLEEQLGDKHAAWRGELGIQPSREFFLREQPAGQGQQCNKSRRHQ